MHDHFSHRPNSAGLDHVIALQREHAPFKKRFAAGDRRWLQFVLPSASNPMQARLWRVARQRFYRTQASAPI